MEWKRHIIDAGTELDVLRSHLVFGHRVTPAGDHEAMDDQHIAAHRAGALTAGHIELEREAR